MSLEIYNFYTEYVLDAPVETVWSILEDAENWPRWVKGFKKIEILGPEPRIQEGSVLNCKVKSSLPYSLNFKLEVVLADSPKCIEYTADGELKGNGRWVLESTDGGTAFKYWWNVGMTNPFLNLISKVGFIKNLMARNHNIVIEEGYMNLKNLLINK